MCGRFALNTTKTEIAKEFKCEHVALGWGKYNIAPSQNITAVIKGDKFNNAVLMRWGLIPSWVKSLNTWKNSLFSASVETVTEKPSFKDSFKKRPCLIPVSGFYEWSDIQQPYYFYTDGSLFALAGIWSSWRNPQVGEQILSCAILTTVAEGTISEIHQRMPVIVPREYYDLWLDRVDGRQSLIESLPKADLQLHPVSKTVNSLKNDRAECIESIAI